MNKLITKYSIVLGAIILVFLINAQNALSIENIVPEDRRIEWEPGLPDEIPDYSVAVNVKDFGAVGDGVNDDTQFFINAINAAGAGSAVLVPAGTYKITSTIEIGKGIVLRGEGQENTKLKFDFNSGGSCIKIVKWGGSGWANITAKFNKGSNSITVSDVSYFDVGDFVEIRQDNDPAVFSPGYSGYESWGDACVGQILEVTGKSGNSITFSNELYYNYNLSHFSHVQYE